MGMVSRSLQMAEATPRERDRFIDAARAFAILVVMLGHWLIAVVTWKDGVIDGANALAVIPGLWLATWALQVMPLFFFVGGASNAWTWRGVERTWATAPGQPGQNPGAAQERSLPAGPSPGVSAGAGAYAAFLAGRVTRLMRPTGVFLAVGLVIATILDASNVADSVLRPATRLITQPLWFIGIYLIVVALAPPMLMLHRRFGAIVPGAMVAGAVIVDVARFAFEIGAVGYFNFALVWLFVHQLGFFYADGRLPLRPWRVAGLGLTLMGLLVLLGPYPGSMVGLPGDAISNMDPPTVVIIALTIWQVGLALVLRPTVAALLERTSVWSAVIMVNGVIMTIFLWHLTALLLAIGILYPLGFPQPAAGTALWWALRPVWIAVLLVLLTGLVAMFGRFEMRRSAGSRAAFEGTSVPAIAVVSALGALYVIVGVLGFALGGLDGLFSTTGSELVVFRVNPLHNVIHLALGAALVALAPRGGRRALAAAAGATVALICLAGLGWLWVGGMGTNYLAANRADNLLHLVTAALALAAAVGLRRVRSA